MTAEAVVAWLLGSAWPALGHFRDGVLLAPATAYYLFEQMRTGNLPNALEPFAPERLLKD